MSPRASLPGADELFRRTSAEKVQPRKPRSTGGLDDKSTKLQVAKETADPGPERKAPRHDEKITFYCTADDLMAIEHARLKLRADHGVAADRGRIVRAALAYVLEDFEARAEDSILLRRLT
ncbi:MAG TPA: hypothetical protein VG929_05345 [Actinomycetota bacterium]|nr:hypothetical protein [Actinomycetota bacterium]